jgi:heme exporter protein CcmD
MASFDKYAPFVFSAYGIAAVVLGGLTLWTIWRVGRAKKKLDEVEPQKPSEEKQP